MLGAERFCMYQVLSWNFMWVIYIFCLILYLFIFNVENHLNDVSAKNTSNVNKKKNNPYLQIKWAQEKDVSCVACGCPYLLTPPPGYWGPYLLRSKRLDYFLKLTWITGWRFVIREKEWAPKHNDMTSANTFCIAFFSIKIDIINFHLLNNLIDFRTKINKMSWAE